MFSVQPASEQEMDLLRPVIGRALALRLTAQVLGREEQPGRRPVCRLGLERYPDLFSASEFCGLNVQIAAI